MIDRSLASSMPAVEHWRGQPGIWPGIQRCWGLIIGQMCLWSAGGCLIIIVCIHPLCPLSPRSLAQTESFLSKVAIESDLQKRTCKNRTCSNRESLFWKKKNCESFHDRRKEGSDTLDSFLSKITFESDIWKRLSKENFLVCHYLKKS